MEASSKLKLLNKMTEIDPYLTKSNPIIVLHFHSKSNPTNTLIGTETVAIPLDWSIDQTKLMVIELCIWTFCVASLVVSLCVFGFHGPKHGRHRRLQRASLPKSVRMEHQTCEPARRFGVDPLPAVVDRICSRLGPLVPKKSNSDNKSFEWLKNLKTKRKHENKRTSSESLTLLICSR